MSGMGRREFVALLGGATAAWPLVARAQQSAMPVIGFLNSASPEAFAPFVAAFQSGLNELGYIEGRNVMIENRSAEGHPDRLPPLVDDLVRRQVAVLVANSTASALAAKSVTSNLPIVFLIGGDPVELGLIASLNRPGGNATGVSFLVNKLVAKRLELLSELASGAVTLGMLVDPNNPNAEPDTKDAQVAADALGRKLLVVKAAAESELDAAFATLTQMQVGNLFVDGNVNFITWRDQIMALAMRYGIAASYATRDFVMAGGLMSYGPDRTEVWRQIGLYAGRILKGAKPADMPVMQSAKFEFVINLRTAKAQALAIPPALLALANEVIE
jgi:putative tryptophan/tyrosine transport system substrate-binding protein